MGVTKHFRLKKKCGKIIRFELTYYVQNLRHIESHLIYLELYCIYCLYKAVFIK